ncbi:uncharacterized protein LOC112561105 [Pomacea canaliculata]|uniref:uncharacterized protein LOC112561105 n=1 Tax=Pomacea canaliculata TaxID=400727 RepID=UPI000D733FDA|nr:uncharacterized protein LOC112561105 [Pomacea canaliculata]
MNTILGINGLHCDFIGQVSSTHNPSLHISTRMAENNCWQTGGCQAAFERALHNMTSLQELCRTVDMLFTCIRSKCGIDKLPYSILQDFKDKLNFLHTSCDLTKHFDEASNQSPATQLITQMTDFVNHLTSTQSTVARRSTQMTDTLDSLRSSATTKTVTSSYAGMGKLKFHVLKIALCIVLQEKMAELKKKIIVNWRMSFLELPAIFFLEGYERKSFALACKKRCLVQDQSPEDARHVMRKRRTSLLWSSCQGNNICCTAPHQRCAAHTLNLVASKDSEAAFQDGAFRTASRSLFAKAQAVWNKQSRAESAAESIQEATGRQMIIPNQTRWNSTYDAVQCLQDLTAEQLSKLADALGLPRFTPRDQLFMKEFVMVMGPLARCLDYLQGEKCVGLGHLLPQLNTLKIRIKQQKSKLEICGPWLTAVLNGWDGDQIC